MRAVRTVDAPFEHVRETAPMRRKLVQLFGLVPATVLLATVALSCPSFGNERPATLPSPQAVKAAVTRIGVGKNVKVTLTGGRKLRGHVSRIGDDAFSIRMRRHGAEKSIQYNEVAAIKDPGPIGWMLVGAAVVIIVIFVVAH